MGAPLQYLSVHDLTPKVIFPNRFVLECDETMHMHIRNLRVDLSEEDFDSIAKAFAEAKKRKEELRIHCKEKQHIELGRGVLVNHLLANKFEITKDLNQYKLLHYDNAEFYDDNAFIHFHYRDYRLEMSKWEFIQLSDWFAEARKHFDKEWKK